MAWVYYNKMPIYSPYSIYLRGTTHEKFEHSPDSRLLRVEPPWRDSPEDDFHDSQVSTLKTPLFTNGVGNLLILDFNGM